MGIKTERELTALADRIMMNCPCRGERLTMEDERYYYQRFDELTEEMVSPMSQEDFLRLAHVFVCKYGLRLL